MGSYLDFLRQHPEGAKPKRLYWVCGDEEILRILTVARIKALADVEPFDTVRMAAGEDSKSEIWATLNQHALDADRRRLVLIHDAHLLEEHLEPLLDWAKDRSSSRNTVAVFVSENTEAPEGLPVSPVRCSLPKAEDSRFKRAVEIVCSWGSVHPTVAGVLVKRVNFDLREAYAVVQKVGLFEGANMSVATVEAVAPRRVEEDVIWSLVSLNKRQAAEALAETAASPSEVIGSLATHVEALGRLHSVLTATTTIRDAATKTGLHEQYVRNLLPHAHLYPHRESVRRTLLLTRLDNALQTGAQEGVLEALVAAW